MQRALLVTMLVLVSFGLAGTVGAHTELDHTTPADGATLAEPVSEIIVAFTLPVTIVGNGFEVLDPSGEIVRPTVTTEDDALFVLAMDEPLAGGDVGVRYEVTAGDGHVLAGGFSFTVTAEPTTTTGASTTVVSTTLAGPVTTNGEAAASTSTSTEPAEGETDPSGSNEYWLMGLGVVGLAGVFAWARWRRGS